MKKPESKQQVSKIYVYCISLVAAVGGFLFGFDLNIMTGATVFLQKVFELTPNEFGFAVSSAKIGCIAGPILGVWMAGWIGRKQTLIIAAVLFGISAIGTAIPKTVLQFNIFRIVGGLGVGLASIVSPMYIAEISPARIRGRLVTLNQFAIVIGSLSAIITAYFLAKYLPEHLSWRFMFGSECLPIIAFVIALFFIPESPRWLVQKGREDEAIKILNRIDGPEHASSEVKVIKEVLNEETGKFSELFLPGIRVALFIGIALAFFQQWTGGTPVATYAPLIFQKAGFTSATDALFQTIILNSFYIFCVILAMCILDRFGRKPLLLLGIAAMTLSLIALGAGFLFNLKGIYILIFMTLAMLAYQTSMGPITWLIISEIFPTHVRAKGMGISAVVIWIASITSTYAYAPLDAFFQKTFNNPAGLFWIYAGICVIAFVFSLKVIPETKGRTLEEIAKSWLNKKKKSNS